MKPTTTAGVFTCDICINSIANCQYCASTTNCAWCNPNYFLYNGACVASCTPPLIFTNESSIITGLGHCYDCSAVPYCASCGTGGCSQCKPGYFLNLTSLACFPCNTTLKDCQLCSDSASCTQCNVNFTVKSGFCVSDCKTCIGGCLTCEGENCDICLSCQTGRSLLDKFCYISCPYNYYSIINANLNNSSECLPCHQSCKSCSGPSDDHCLSCSISPDINYLQSKSCVSSCPDSGYYSDTTNFLCLTCDPTCDTCTGPNNNDCKVENYYIFKKIL